MAGSVAYYAILGGLVFFGAMLGNGLVYIPFKWAARRRNTLLARAIHNLPAAVFWQRILILGTVGAAFSAITADFPYRAPILSFMFGVSFSCLECSYGLLQGFLIAKKAADNFTVEEREGLDNIQRIKKLGYNPNRIRRMKS